MASLTLWLTTLGCAKNQVDSEKVISMLSEAGYTWADSPETADVVMTNTCAFIEEARAESVETILELEDRKRPGAKSIVIGCMAQRFGTEVEDALPEVDAVLGLDRYGELIGTLDDLTEWRPVNLIRRPAMDILHATGRPASDLPYAYLKVAEGCNKPCTFCAIPLIRGKQRSRRPNEIREELRRLTGSGIGEVVLVAQDLAAHGRDIDAPGDLSDLLVFLSDVEGLRHLRLLYLHPKEIRQRLLETMVSNPVVVPYFDLSLQHVSIPLLRAMKRPGNTEKHLELIGRIRAPSRKLHSDRPSLLGFLERQMNTLTNWPIFLRKRVSTGPGSFPTRRSRAHRQRLWTIRSHGKRPWTVCVPSPISKRRSLLIEMPTG